MDDALPPYASFLNLSARREDDGTLIWSMPFGDDVLGRPGYLHGGAIAGLLEFAALGALRVALDGTVVRLKPINVSVEYLRGGGDSETFAAAQVNRLGSRVANVEAHAWQQDRRKPIASARMNILLDRKAVA